MPIHPRTLNIKSFKGLHNRLDPEHTPQDYLKTVDNIDIDISGSLNKREGYIRVDSANYSCLWSSTNGLGCYAVRNGDLVRINSDLSHSTLKSNVGNTKLSFEEVDGLVYFSSDSTNGIIDNGSVRSFGITKNTLTSVLSVVPGTLPAGTYQVSFSYVSSNGRESGTSVASQIVVPDNSGISLYIPTHIDSNISFARIYCSNQNSETLFYSGISLLGMNYVVSTLSNLSNPLRVFNLDKAPLGHILSYYKGRMYVASDNILWYSEPFQYEYYRLDSNYIEFPDKITAIMPSEDGIWIGSDKLYYLQGDNPDSFRRITKDISKVVEGTSTRVSGSYSVIDGLPPGYKWVVTTDLGLYILCDQGTLLNATSATVAISKANSGNSMFLQNNGMNRYLSILKTDSDPINSASLGDLVETSIVRNGVTIP